MEKKVLPNQQVKVLTEALQKATEANQAQAKELAFLRPLVGEQNKATARPSGMQEIQKAPRIPGADLRKQISSHVLELMRRAQDLDALAAEIGPLSEPAERMLSRLFYNSERKNFH